MARDSSLLHVKAVCHFEWISSSNLFDIFGSVQVLF